MTRTWTLDEVAQWFADHLPEDWFVQAPELSADRDEILLTGELVGPQAEGDRAAEAQAIEIFREATREQRVAVAQQAEALWGRKVSWAARCGETRSAFTTASVPVMTRLRLSERQVLDTLIDAGVAKSRSDALGWCVRLVATNEGEWIERLRQAMTEVEKVRADGPSTPPSSNLP
ncbi:MAG: hypothetical protein OEW42_10550 [Acidimicrobiia bacterium]|nr:hypothetical protein [Acidimicrobiia bacterium]